MESGVAEKKCNLLCALFSCDSARISTMHFVHFSMLMDEWKIVENFGNGSNNVVSHIGKKKRRSHNVCASRNRFFLVFNSNIVYIQKDYLPIVDDLEDDRTYFVSRSLLSIVAPFAAAIVYESVVFCFVFFSFHLKMINCFQCASNTITILRIYAETNKSYFEYFQQFYYILDHLQIAHPSHTHTHTRERREQI